MLTQWMLRQPKTQSGCVRKIEAILRAYQRDFAGGGSFGWDWPTFKLNSLQAYERVRELQNLCVELPFSDGTRLPR